MVAQDRTTPRSQPQDLSAAATNDEDVRRWNVMSPLMSSKSQTTQTAYVQSQHPLRDANAVHRYLRNFPLIHTNEDDAIEEALQAAPSEEDPEETLVYLAQALGGIPGQSPEDFPVHVSYVTQLVLRDFRIETTEATDRDAQLAYAMLDEPPDALWLPSEETNPTGHQLRILMTDELKDRIGLVTSITLPARYRPPR